MFLKIMHEKIKKAQNDETQEKQGFFQNDKKRIYDFFETFVQKQNDNFF